MTVRSILLRSANKLADWLEAITGGLASRPNKKIRRPTREPPSEAELLQGMAMWNYRPRLSAKMQQQFEQFQTTSEARHEQ